MGIGTLSLLNLIGGVAILLWGLRMVRTGAMRALGGNLRSVIKVSTQNRFLAALTGAGMTAMVQSSTAVILLISSFASRGLIKTGPALATVLGADVGTTIVAQALSFDLSFLSPLFALVGLTLFMSADGKTNKNIGRILLGLALMLMALQEIVGASSPMRDSSVIQQLISALGDELFMAMLLAALMTWLSHSSLAMVLLVITLSASGDIPTDLAFVLVLGINIGGTLPAVSATLGGAIEGRRVAIGNLFFRLIGTILVFPFLDYIAPLLATLESEPARQVANFHMAFNIVLALFFILLTEVMARFVTRLLPETNSEELTANQAIKPIYINEDQISSVSHGLNNASREALRMGDVVYRMLTLSREAFQSNDPNLIKTISQLEDDVDHLNEAIKFYVTEITRSSMSLEDSERCMTIMSYVTNLEHIGDLIERNLMELAQSKQKKNLNFSAEGTAEIDQLHERLIGNLQLSFNLFLSQDELDAEQLLSEKRAFREVQMTATQKHLERLRAGNIESMESSSIHLDLLRDYKQINSHITSLSYSILEAGNGTMLLVDKSHA